MCQEIPELVWVFPYCIHGCQQQSQALSVLAGDSLFPGRVVCTSRLPHLPLPVLIKSFPSLNRKYSITHPKPIRTNSIQYLSNNSDSKCWRGERECGIYGQILSQCLFLNNDLFFSPASYLDQVVITQERPKQRHFKQRHKARIVSHGNFGFPAELLFSKCCLYTITVPLLLSLPCREVSGCHSLAGP